MRCFHILFVIVSFLGLNINAQIPVYQDIFKGGVTGDAFNPVNLPFGGDFEVYIEPGSTIRKAYLFISVYNFPNEEVLYFNNYPIHLREQDAINNDYFLIKNNDIRRIRTLMTDVTHLIHPLQNSYSVSALIQSPSLIPGIYCEYYLYIAYDNPTLQEICSNVFINNIQPDAHMLYTFSNLNPINSTQNVGLAINADNICDTIRDGSFVKVNNIPIGLIGGDEINSLSSCTGVTGSFYYQNGTLTGLRNDIANPTMSGPDAIANIESYLNSTTAFDLTFDYQSNWEPKTNTINQLFLTYTSPCQPFDVSVPKDTTICKGTTIQLNASGGQSYEWLSPTNSTSSNPAPGLSCSNCPNPIFTADSSMFYTVRIWNNDTSTGSACSVVRPVKITVKKPPVLPQLSTVKAQCGVASGSIGIKNPKESGNLYILSENGDTLVKPIVANQNTNQGGLFGGTYTVYFQDAFGCTSGDTTLTIGTINNTIANFMATPQSGSAPLEVTFTNTSQNAQQFQWFVNGELQPNPFTSFVADTSGSYQITLVAWKNDLSCADTAQLTVIAYDSLIVGIPNVFSPNNDGVNDVFSITVNQPVKCELVIVNRWGEKMFSYSGNLTVGMNDLWSADATVSDGVYFYSVKMETSPPPLSPSKGGNPHQLSREGFVTVVR